MEKSEDLLDNLAASNNGGVGKLPNAVAVLVLGILSIVFCLFYGIVGLILGIIAIALHQKDKSINLSNPKKYAESFKLSRAGFVCAVIGTCLSALYILIIVIAIAIGANYGMFR